MRRQGMGIVVIGIAVLGACGGDGDGSVFDDLARESAAEQAEADAESEAGDEGGEDDDGMALLWSADIRVVSRPVEVDGADVVAVLGTADGALFAAAFDPATGAEVWRRDSTASEITPGVIMGLPVDDGRVYHLAAGEDGDVVQALDAATGEPVWTSEPAEDGFRDILTFCDRSEESLCITALGSDVSVWQLDAETGEQQTPAPTSGLRGRPAQVPDIERGLGPDIYELEGGDIARIVGGVVLWQRSPSDLFGGAAVTPNFGWQFREVGDLIVATLGPDIELPEGESPITSGKTAGIDAATGETRWVEDGSMHCGQHGLGLRDGSDAPWLRCIETGTWTWRGDTRIGVDTTMTLSGFDPETGAAEWTVEMPRVVLGENEQQLLIRLDDTSFAMGMPGGEVAAVDIAEGTVLDLGDGTIGWCVAYNEYEYAESYSGFRVGESFTLPCDLTGAGQEAPREPDRFAGPVVDDVFVWMDENGLHGAS